MTTADEPVRSGEVELLPLQLEYFRRYHLDVQLRYYKGRGEEHAIAAGSIRARRRLFAVLSATLGLPIVYFIVRIVLNNMGIDTSGFSSLNTAFYFVAAVLPILISTNRSLSLLSQDERNASRYAHVYANLQLLKDEYLESAREAAEAGDKEGLLSFVYSVNEQISSEHREWISLTEDRLRHKFETISKRRLPNLPSQSGL